MRSARKESASNMYRVVVCAAAERLLFCDERDREYFLSALQSALKGKAEVLAWCLTSKYAQFVLWADLQSLSSAFQALLAFYARACNRRHGCTGRLYHDRFFSEPIETDEQLLASVCAIHRFPQQVGESEGGLYGWSSYREYLGAPKLVNTVPVLGAAGDRDAFRRLHSASRVSQARAHVPRPRVQVGDKDALEQVKRVFGTEPRKRIAALERAERNAGLRALKEAGLSARQICQFTGVGRGVVEKL